MSISWQRSEPPPALVVHPPAAASLDEAHSAIALWEHYSRKTLDSAQRLAVELMMAETEDGQWAARTTGRAEPRQNGKGDEIEVPELWGLVQRGEWIVHTCHEDPTAKSAWERMVGLLTSHPDLESRVDRVIGGNGPKYIYMTRKAGGGRVVYRTRTGSGARGLDDISRLVVDEAQHAQGEMLASSTPVVLANPNPQINYIGSAGIADKSDFWWGLRVRALKEDGGSFSWLEHSAEEVGLSRDGRVISSAPDPEDRQAWGRANPALGVRFDESALESQLADLGPALFAREHLCVWDPYPGADEGFLPFDQWAGLVVPEAEAAKASCYGLSVSEDGRYAAVASAGRMPSGDLYVDVVRNDSGTDWVLEDVVDRWGRKRTPLRVNPAAPEGAFVRPLREAGVEVVEVTSRQYQQGCGEVLDAVKNGTIRHLGQPALDRAVRAAQRRDVGKDGSWVWAESASGVDLSTLRAATLALTGVSARRPPRVYVYKPKEA